MLTVAIILILCASWLCFEVHRAPTTEDVSLLDVLGGVHPSIPLPEEEQP